MKNIEDLAPIHIVGIGGIGMSAIAEVLHNHGIEVGGSDQKDGANVRRLIAKGIKTKIGHNPENVNGARLVVLSSAVKADNPELIAAKKAGITVWSRADMLASLMENYKTISVTGTHGKTTTTSMIAWIFEQAGLDPTVITGGIINGWGTNARIGHGEWMIVEADESDGTFVKLPTHIGVVTNIDPEHLDFYKTVEAMEATFQRFFEGVKPDGLTVAGIDHPVVRRFFDDGRAAGRRLLGYGVTEEADVRLDATRVKGASQHLEMTLATEARSHGDVVLPVPGHYNALNALAAVAVALEVGICKTVIRKALESFDGVKRRFSLTGTWDGVSIYDDYAHHPTEIDSVLGAARGATCGRVIAVFQPHRYSRLTNLFEDFCACFSHADTVVVTPIYTAGEAPNGMDRDTLVKALRARKQDVLVVDTEEGLAHEIVTHTKPGDLVIGLGAGTITEWMHALPNRLVLADQTLNAAE
jgi:UDP-N-acetylmuramate--alanine ligase